MSPKSLNEVDKYISSFPEDVQEKLQTIRRTILAEIPDAEEKLGYGIPTYKLNGRNIVHFGGFKNHVGFYPTPSGLTTFADELEKYKVSKGTAQFPHDKPLPLGLVRKIVKFRVKEEKEKSAKK
jgi:uncharacterized protein YdhG (YjbR/CyaY superfamily)